MTSATRQPLVATDRLMASIALLCSPGFSHLTALIATAEAVFGFTMVVGNNACEIVLARKRQGRRRGSSISAMRTERTAHPGPLGRVSARQGDREPVSGIEPLTCRLQEPCSRASGPLAATMPHEGAAAAPKTERIPGDPFHDPFHAAGLRAVPAQRYHSPCPGRADVARSNIGSDDLRRQFWYVRVAVPDCR
jgi:hypothetical protein